MKTSALLILIFTLVLSLSSAETVDTSQVHPYSHRQYFEADPSPVPLNLRLNPLKYAFKRIGLDPDTFHLPRAWENNYRTVARFPIIDQVSEKPLYMKVWAERESEKILNEHQGNAINAARSVLTTLRGTNTPSGLRKGSYFYFADWLDKNGIDWPFTPQFRDIVNEFLFNLSVAKISIRGARMGLTDEDLAFFADNPGYYLTPDGQRMPSLTGSTDTHIEFINRARKINIDAILTGAEAAASAVHAFREKTSFLNAADIFYKGDDTTVSYTFDTPIGLLVIGGYGPDTLTRDAAVIIELGGNDLYRNNAGGCDSPLDEVAVCLDQSGNDTYEAAGQKYVQGFGFMGAGILADFGGDDKYKAGHFSQGGGIIGMGMLWDKEGNDIFEAQAFCQGAGMFGLGILLNDIGDDIYHCATIGQGGAMTLGMGVLSDLNGNDKYRLAVGDNIDALGRLPGYGQGGALSFRHYPWKGKLTPYGGVGMLLDNAGDDDYLSNGWCDQGGSYILSLGVLYDTDGNDRYDSHVGQGSGIHITNAILIDRAGNDYYRGEFRAGGSGGDRSPGFLIDYAGDDTYDSKTSSYGTGVKPYSLSLFIDYNGVDRYICPEPEGNITFNNWDSFGGVWPESEPYHWPYAIALDLGKEDIYEVRNRANNSERHSFGHGIHLDLGWNGGDLITGLKPAMFPYERQPLPEKIKMTSYAGLFKGLQNSATFSRFHNIGKLKEYGPKIIPDIVHILDNSVHRQINRDMLELLNCIIYENELFPDDISLLSRLLRAEDYEVRAVMADNFRVWNLEVDDADLVAAARDDLYGKTRRYILKSLMQKKSEAGFALASELAVSDPSPMVRRQAVEYLGEVGDSSSAFLLLSLLMRDETDPMVRVEIAEAFGKIGNPEAIPILNELKETYDPYLKRAIGKSLCELYQVEGIKLLIESLDFPSIDAFVNYNYNIPNFIAAYSGHDLPENRRYDQQEWLKWYNANKEQIDIKTNVDSYKVYRDFKGELTNLTIEQQIYRLEDFLEMHPGNIHAADELAEKLNQAAWDMVTAAEGTPSYDPTLGLQFARRAIELKNNPNYFDTYIEALIVNGDIDAARRICRDMIELYPGNEMFEKRMEQINKILQ